MAWLQQVMQRCIGLSYVLLGSIGLALYFAGPAESQQDWITELSQAAYGKLHLTRTDRTSSDLEVTHGWSGNVPEHETADAPAAVLVARGNSDVIAAVDIARRYNLTIAASGGRHWVVNARSAAGGITVDLSEMRGVIVDPVQHTAVAQGGALGGDVLHEAALWGLSLPWGDVNCTGMGLALGGGIGLAMRRHGLACDNILAARIVLANGSLVTVSSTEHPELLAGLRGAGTVFGIVTELTFRLFNGTSDVYAGHLVFADDSKFTTYRCLHEFTTAALAKHPGLGIELFSFSTNNEAMILVNFFGDQSMQDKAAVFEPLRALGPIMDKLGPRLSNIVAVNDDLSGLVTKVKLGPKRFYFSGIMTKKQVSDGGLDALLQAHALAPEIGSGLLTDWLGGATENTTSFTPFKGAYMHFLMFSTNPDSQTMFSAAEQMEEILAAYAILYPYSNLSPDPYPESNLAAKVGGAENLQRLQHLKALVDPDNMFKNHQFRGLNPHFTSSQNDPILAQQQPTCASQL